MTASGLTASLLRFANDLVGHIKGGLGHVNMLISMLFAGISGSALADSAGPRAIVMRMMRRAGYSPDYAGAISAATATIGPIIPPSILMVIYAISDSRVWDVIPLGGNVDRPEPLPGNIVCKTHMGLVGDGGVWGQRLISFLGSNQTMAIYQQNGLLKL